MDEHSEPGHRNDEHIYDDLNLEDEEVLATPGKERNIRLRSYELLDREHLFPKASPSLIIKTYYIRPTDFIFSIAY